MLRTEALSQSFGINIATGGLKLLERDREITQSKKGISWYDGDLASDLDTVLSELWLPDHSLALVNRLNQKGGITLVGAVGSGKSTLLYGTRAILRARGMPYVNINGHYTNIEGEDIVSVVDSAEDNGMTIIYDSADYLASGHRKVRALPLERHLPRNMAIMRRLIDFREDGGNLLLSSHNQDWIDDRAHPNLSPTWTELVDQTDQEEVNVTLPTVVGRERLLGKVGLDIATADFVSQLPTNARFLDHIISRWGDHRYMDWAQEGLTSYQILKLLAKDGYGENEPVLDKIRGTLSEGRADTESWDAVLDFVFSKTYLLAFYTKQT